MAPRGTTPAPSPSMPPTGRRAATSSKNPRHGPKGGSVLKNLLIPVLVCALIGPIGYFFKELRHARQVREANDGAPTTPNTYYSKQVPVGRFGGGAVGAAGGSVMDDLDAELEAELAQELEIKRLYPPPAVRERAAQLRRAPPAGGGGTVRDLGRGRSGGGAGGGGGGDMGAGGACPAGRPSGDAKAVFAHLAVAPLPASATRGIHLPLSEGDPGFGGGAKGGGSGGSKGGAKGGGKGGKGGGGGASQKRQPSCERYRGVDTSRVSDAVAAAARFLAPPGSPGAAPACLRYRLPGSPARLPFGGRPVGPDGRPPASANEPFWAAGVPSALSGAQDVHCGFAGNSGFDLDTDMREFADCSVVVLTVIFGAQDLLHQPKASAMPDRVCYVAFTDVITLQAHMAQNLDHPTEGAGGRVRGHHQVGLWTVVVVQNLPYPDPRRNARIPKTLTNRLFPTVRWTIWIDSKMQLRADPIVMLHQALWKEGNMMAVSQHPVRLGLNEEIEALEKKGMFPKKGDGLAQQAAYARAGYPRHSQGLPDTSVLVRDHGHPAMQAVQCAWFNEIDRFTVRDQASFNYVLFRMGFRPTLPKTAFMQDPTGGSGKRDHAYKDTLTYHYKSDDLDGARVKMFAYCDHWEFATEKGHARRSGVGSPGG